MSGVTGIHDISTLLATQNQTALQFGPDRLVASLRAELDAHNARVREQLDELCEIGTERIGVSGVSSAGDMDEVDEYGRAESKVVQPGIPNNYPLGLFQHPISWTRTTEEEATVADYAQATINAEIAHSRRVARMLKRAIFTPTTRTNVLDRLVDKLPLTIRPFFNADGQALPAGMMGESFATSHTHYVGYATLTTTALDTEITNLVEHGFGTTVRAYVNRAQEATVRALTGFTAYVDRRFQYVAPNTPDTRLDTTRVDNRAIGVYSAAEVWTKPWVPAGYVFLTDVGNPAKPLYLRERVAGSMNLRIAAEIDAHPLRSEFMEAKFGVGVRNRGNGVVIYIGGGSYVAPTGL